MTYNKIINFKTIKAITFIFVIMILFDLVVLSLLKKEWQVAVFDVQKKPLRINYNYGFISYIFLVIGLYYSVYRNIRKGSWKYDTLIEGFIYGVLVYGTFDFTNLAIFSDYPLNLALLDTLFHSFSPKQLYTNCQEHLSLSWLVLSA